MQNLLLRQEAPTDYLEVNTIVRKTFEQAVFSDQTEHLLVARLRKSAAFIPELSIVAEFDGQIVGHILLTKILIVNPKGSFGSLALAPVSVIPTFQKKGIGAKLILNSHQVAHSLGYKSIILLGHEGYYPRFGYLPTSTYNIKLPFEAPEKNCMAIELVENGLQDVHGMVKYPNAFFE